jgi:ParB-like chromosome segregation protein Spo0J
MFLAGHGRLEAARLEGLEVVPVVRFGHLSMAQKRAYLIADNKIAEQAGWNREMLAIELGELIDLLPAKGFDVALTGFEAAEIDLLLADMAPRGRSQKMKSQLCPRVRQPAGGICGSWQNTDSYAAMRETPATLPV